ncbi:hypothetical protein P43SY_003378 [Pythium insidiosum]|uniref:Uncharacterized protein n=1 Tax=Pythium insidiosum TaxID=114742 RepID=A0AAD5Q579_PYTIN|nr:hypothetical protein P43SY_003378 [Pythium insidiosum]
MPTLRATRGGETVELRSAKSLVGSNAATCDIVLPQGPGVLELHALLNLSDDKSSATLVPFAATPTTAGGDTTSAEEVALSAASLSTAERNYAEIEKLRLSQRLREVNNETQQEHSKTLATMEAQLVEMREEIQRLQEEKRVAVQQENDDGEALRSHWLHTVHETLQDEVVQADTRLSRVSKRLEDLLQQYEALHSSSLGLKSGVKLNVPKDRHLAETPPVDKHTKYLCEMLYQRFKRLHQLYHAIGKLAATVPSSKEALTDTAKLRHAVFLVDLMHDRARNHIAEVLKLHTSLLERYFGRVDRPQSVHAARSF